MGRLKGKRALITGGSSGIGQATSILFSKEGASVTVVDTDEKKGFTVVDQIQSLGGRAIFVKCDVSQADECQFAVEQTVSEFGGLDILFNNAAIIRRTTILDISEDEWDQVMAVNVKSIFLLSKFAIPYMVQHGGGSIINTSSGWGLVGGSKAVSYCASKGAVVNMTKAMAIDHGDQNIRVNCVCPGDIDTNMLRVEAKQLGEPYESFLVEAANRPLKRIGNPEDVAQAVLYLASDDSSFVTGITLVVDGGGLAG